MVRTISAKLDVCTHLFMCGFAILCYKLFVTDNGIVVYEMNDRGRCGFIVPAKLPQRLRKQMIKVLARDTTINNNNNYNNNNNNNDDNDNNNNNDNDTQLKPTVLLLTTITTTPTTTLLP